MSRAGLALFGCIVLAAFLIAPPLLVWSQRKEMRNFRIVREGVLYRSGQLSLRGLKRAVHDYGIRTVVSLRDGHAPADRDEEQFCQEQGITFIRIPPRAWEGPGGRAPVELGVADFLKVMRDPANHPVLLHCFAGVHRTGAYTAIYRMEFEGWGNARAMAEMKDCGYEALDHEWD